MRNTTARGVPARAMTSAPGRYADAAMVPQDSSYARCLDADHKLRLASVLSR